MKKYISKNEKETLSLSKKIAKTLKNGETIALIGNLGSGKTVFTGGIAKSLGIKHPISSPTFNILKVYDIPRSIRQAPDQDPSARRQTKLCHIDAYRLKNSRDLKELGINDYIKSPNIITLIEWADKAMDSLPEDSIIIKFQTTDKENERIITVHKK